MLSQALFTGVPRSCRAAVPRVAVSDAVLGREVSSINPGADCRARAKVTAGVVRRLAEGVATRCEADVPDEWRWHGFRTWVTQRLSDQAGQRENLDETYVNDRSWLFGSAPAG